MEMETQKQTGCGYVRTRQLERNRTCGYGLQASSLWKKYKRNNKGKRNINEETQETK